MYFSYLNLTLCANKGSKPFTWLFPTSKITWCIVLQLLKFLHKQSLFKMQPKVGVRCSFWVQKKQRGTKVYENGNIANVCAHSLLSANFPRFFSKMSAASMLLALGELWGNISTTAVLLCLINCICICVISHKFHLLISCWICICRTDLMCLQIR